MNFRSSTINLLQVKSNTQKDQIVSNNLTIYPRAKPRIFTGIQKHPIYSRVEFTMFGTQVKIIRHIMRQEDTMHNSHYG